MKKIIFIITISFSMFLMAQDNKSTQEIDTKSAVTETYLQLKIDKEVNALNKDILDNRERTLENKNEINNLFITKLSTQGLLISLVLSLLGFFSLGYYLKEYLKSKISKNVVSLESECDSSIDKVREIERETLLRIQNTEIENADLRAKSQILLISETATPVNDTIEHIFERKTAKVAFNCVHIRIKELSFKQVEIALANKGNLLPSDFDIMVLDNCDAENRFWEGEHFNKNIINFMEKFLSKQIGVLFFSDNQRINPNLLDMRALPNKFLLGFVNSHAQLYSNTMNVLKLKNLYS